eukprot:Pgem_evm2s18099
MHGIYLIRTISPIYIHNINDNKSSLDYVSVRYGNIYNLALIDQGNDYITVKGAFLNNKTTY